MAKKGSPVRHDVKHARQDSWGWLHLTRCGKEVRPPRGPTGRRRVCGLCMRVRVARARAAL